MHIKINDFRPYRKNTLQGFATIQFVENKLELRDVALHDKNGSRWFQLPAKPFDKPSGERGWNYIVAFADKDSYAQFQELALMAFDAYQGETRRNGYAGQDQTV